MGIQGALYSGVSGMSVNSTSMEVIGNNIANSNTYGYKTSRTVFSDALNNAVSSSSGVAQVGSGAMLSSVDSVFGQGTFESTTSNTDLAIQGDGFFMVEDPDSGNLNYTRAGAFRIQDGSLINPEGYVVQGYDIANVDSATGNATGNPEDITGLNIGVTANTDGALLESVSVNGDGVVTGKFTDGTTEDYFYVAISKFGNPSGLLKEGNSMYSQSDVSGSPQKGTVKNLGGTIYSSTLEMSNVDLAQEFVKMITTQRGFQASSKIITTTDELLNEVINLKR